jgi:predicted aconitase
MLRGEYGSAIETAMSVLVKLGDIYAADKMIPISNVHIDASTYAGIHEAGLHFCTELAEQKSRFCVPTTLCISAIDFDQWRKMRIPSSFAQKQIELAKAYAVMGAIPTWTCAPYQYGVGVRFGQNIAWGESNAIAYANSVIGARTNRYADLVDICAALVGKVPRFGLYLNENRRGQVLFSVEKIKDRISHFTCTDYATLGYYIGSVVEQKVPVVEGISAEASPDKLKSLAAAGATSGSLALFHIVGITPEARSLTEAFGNDVAEEKVVIEREDLRRFSNQLSTRGRPSKVDLVVLGCPHYSIEQIGHVAAWLEGKRIKREVQLWIFTNEVAKLLAEKTGYLRTIERAGGNVLCSTCPLHIPLEGWKFEVMATDSAKMAHYAPALLGMDVIYADTRECLKYSIEDVRSK